MMISKTPLIFCKMNFVEYRMYFVKGNGEILLVVTAFGYHLRLSISYNDKRKWQKLLSNKKETKILVSEIASEEDRVTRRDNTPIW